MITRLRSKPATLPAIAAAGAVLLFTQKEAVDRLIRDLSASPMLVRPAIILVIAVLAGLTVFSAGQAWLTIRQYHNQFTWKASLRSISWILYLINISLIALGLLISLSPPNEGPLIGIATISVVEGVAPLVVGIQTALLFSPEDEPLLELKLAYPRPFMWVIFERLSVMLAIQTTISLCGIFATLLILKDGDTAILILRWLAPTLFLVGIGLRVTLSTRQIVFGILMVIVFWIAYGLFGNQAVSQYPFLWPFHIFLQPERFTATDYLLNRLMIASIGVGLLIAAVHTLRNNEFVLTGKE